MTPCQSVPSALDQSVQKARITSKRQAQIRPYFRTCPQAGWCDFRIRARIARPIIILHGCGTKKVAARAPCTVTASRMTREQTATSTWLTLASHTKVLNTPTRALDTIASYTPLCASTCMTLPTFEHAEHFSRVIIISMLHPLRFARSVAWRMRVLSRFASSQLVSRCSAPCSRTHDTTITTHHPLQLSRSRKCGKCALLTVICLFVARS
jgi:hypothetical protein